MNALETLFRKLPPIVFEKLPFGDASQVRRDGSWIGSGSFRYASQMVRRRRRLRDARQMSDIRGVERTSELRLRRQSASGVPSASADAAVKSDGGNGSGNEGSRVFDYLSRGSRNWRAVGGEDRGIKKKTVLVLMDTDFISKTRPYTRQHQSRMGGQGQ